MRRAALIEFHMETTTKALALLIKKNEDYASDENPFANFSRVNAMGICSTMEGFLVRMTDKMSRLSNFAKRQKFSVKDETLTDTCLDLINYATLLLAWTESSQSEAEMEE